jgi:hypothetical protein
MNTVKVTTPGNTVESVTAVNGPAGALVTEHGDLTIKDNSGRVIGGYAAGQWVKFSSDQEQVA